jgi:hypothetical protein
MLLRDRPILILSSIRIVRFVASWRRPRIKDRVKELLFIILEGCMRGTGLEIRGMGRDMRSFRMIIGMRGSTEKEKSVARVATTGHQVNSMMANGKMA